MLHTKQVPTTAILDERRLEAAVREWLMECGREMQKRRKDLNWSQQQVAELCGVNTTTICRAELGTLAPKDSVRLAIASALFCEVDDIWKPLTRNYVMNVSRVVAA